MEWLSLARPISAFLCFMRKVKCCLSLGEAKTSWPTLQKFSLFFFSVLIIIAAVITPPPPPPHSPIHVHPPTFLFPWFTTDVVVCLTFDMSKGDYKISKNSSERWTTGTQLDIKCHSGYRLTDGHNQVHCSAEGKWVPESPECKRKSWQNE